VQCLLVLVHPFRPAQTCVMGCRRRGVGAAPVAVQKLTKARLLAQLRVLMQPEVIEAAAHLGSQMQQVRLRQDPCIRSPDAPPA